MNAKVLSLQPLAPLARLEDFLDNAEHREIAARFAIIQFLKTTHIDRVRLSHLTTQAKMIFREAIDQLWDALDRGELSIANDCLRVSPLIAVIAENTSCKVATVRKWLRYLYNEGYFAGFEVKRGRGNGNDIQICVTEELFKVLEKLLQNKTC